MAAVAEQQQPVANGAPAAEKTREPLKVPLEAPMPQSRPKERPALTADQASKYDWLLKKVQAWETVGGNPKSAKSSSASSSSSARPLDDTERRWLTRECLLRYLRATKWREHEAEKRLIETLVWRREYGVVERLTFDHISPENGTGKQVIVGFDNEGRVCQYLSPGRQNTDVGPRQVQHLVFMVERVIELMPPGQETLALLINFKQSKQRSNTAPGIGQGREVLNILQTHYPERLGKALIINVPWIVWGFFKLITPFIDPLTREKLKFNEDMTQYVPAEQLWTEYPGGQLDFEYDHEVYWPALMKLCEERTEAQRARWIAGGKLIGEHEDYLKGATERGAASPEPNAPAAAPVQAEAMESAGTVGETEAKEPAEVNGHVESQKEEEQKPEQDGVEGAKSEEAAKPEEVAKPAEEAKSEEAVKPDEPEPALVNGTAAGEDSTASA